MPRRSALTDMPPYAVEQAVRRLGANLRTARLRRNIGAVQMAERLGVDRHVVADAERGKLTTGIATYVGLLWALGLLDQLTPVADPARDAEALALDLAAGRERARAARTLSDDF